MFVLFIILIIGPVIASKLGINPKVDIMELQQPSNWDNNDTTSSQTGTAIGGSGASATASAGAKMMARMFSFDS